MPMKPLGQLLSLDLTLKHISEVAKNMKKLLAFQDFNLYFKLLALKHTWRQLRNTTMKNKHDYYKSLDTKIPIK